MTIKVLKVHKKDAFYDMKDEIEDRIFYNAQIARPAIRGWETIHCTSKNNKQDFCFHAVKVKVIE